MKRSCFTTHFYYFKGGLTNGGIEVQTFIFSPFGALFCRTLFCIVAVRIFAIRSRYMQTRQMDLLKDLVTNGGLSEVE
ncbi:hypothetical protein EKG37_05915 [Robertmurraya yapensis]|uniref:Uncharacterized protein n=1 Tax=Bacillus yapensis TaxID=2492960 RepID=A0A3S0ILZ3_9BACI|nr:hypothetical protein EKG37_05915 [Bacillus yapensis]TKS97921.1 hypothetical protein FAR12_05915 [Bacillus yapensis]